MDAEIREPQVGVWREITNPLPDPALCMFWYDTLEAQGLNDLRVDTVKHCDTVHKANKRRINYYVLMARRRG